MNKTYLLSAIIFLFISCKTNYAESDIDLDLKKELSSSLIFLSSDNLKGRAVGSDGINKAASYLESKLRLAGIPPYFDQYKDKVSDFLVDTYNIIGFIEGKNKKFKNEIVILSAHYDHIGELRFYQSNDYIANGANDNASGVSMLLSIASRLAKEDLQRSVMIVFFSAEETGLVGSRHLATLLKHKKDSIYFMLNFEMLGVPMNRNYATYLTGYEKSNMGEIMQKNTHDKLVSHWKSDVSTELFYSSDNAPFYEILQIPAHSISSFDFQNYKYYHHADDEFDKINFDFMTKTTIQLIPGLVKMINSENREIKIN